MGPGPQLGILNHEPISKLKTEKGVVWENLVLCRPTVQGNNGFFDSKECCVGIWSVVVTALSGSLTWTINGSFTYEILLQVGSVWEWDWYRSPPLCLLNSWRQPPWMSNQQSLKSEGNAMTNIDYKDWSNQPNSQNVWQLWQNFA